MSTPGDRDPTSGNSPESNRSAKSLDPLPPPPKDRFQVRLSDLFIVMFGVALGLSGGTWVSPGIFALIVGMLALAAPFVLEAYDYDERFVRVVWATLIVSYWMALGVAAMRS